jgi:hypothetical protein
MARKKPEVEKDYPKDAVLVMARPRNQDEAPDFNSFRRLGRVFPVMAPNWANGEPVAIREDELSDEEWRVLLGERMLVVENNGVLGKVIDRLGLKEDELGVTLVGEGAFLSLAPVTLASRKAEDDTGEGG